jgi:hypothetical protein
MYHEAEGPGCLYILSDKPYFEWVYLQKLAKDAGVQKAITNKHDNLFGVAVYDEMPALSCTFEAGGRFPPNVVRAGTKLFINPLLKNKLPAKVLIDILGGGVEFLIDNDCGMKFDLHFISRHPHDNKIGGIFRRKGWHVDDPLLYCIDHPDHPSSWKHVYYKGDRSVWSPPSMTVEQYKQRFSLK